MHPDRTLMQIWAEIGESIVSGEIRGLFVVMQYEGAMPAYDSALHSRNLDDLLYQVKTEWIKARARAERQETTN